MTTATEATKLSKRQRRMLKFLREYIAREGYAPTVREIGVGCDISSTSIVAYNLGQLQDRGYIRRAPGRVRAIAVVERK
ncbi:MAG TPA: hypothetical protein PKA36_11925 [Pseudoxanthomonas mexicana]|nr:hypothetical protein [Pseudoxanthomonas mexicana]